SVVLIDPMPVAAPQMPPPAAVHIHVALAISGGSTSVTVTGETLLGPPCLPVMVSVVLAPAVTTVWPSSLVTARTASGAVSRAAALAMLFPGTGSGGVGLFTVGLFTSGGG